MAGEFHRGLEKMTDESELGNVKNSLNELKNKDFESTVKKHLDPENEVTKALNQAKDSADLANEAEKVKETVKTSANDGLNVIKENSKILKDDKITKNEENKISSVN